MASTQLSAWSRFIFGRGPARAALLASVGLLAGCEGEVTMDLATELPSDPAITQVVADVRGVEFTTSGGGTETLEFRDSEPVDFIALATDNGVMRLFTGEELSEGNYTGVRLLFDEDRADDAFVTTSDGREFPLILAESDYAPLSFSIDDNDSSSDSFTLLLDLRKALRFDDDRREYTLTPTIRAVDTEDMSRIDGDISITCPAGDDLGEGAIYLFTGRDVTPDDIDGAGVEPFATTPVFTSQGGASLFYSLRYLPAGDYTLAVTCIGNDEDPAVDDDLEFRNIVNIDLDEAETIRLDLP
ncbi:DUF4382 domain-containing protein [Steroidobacter sp. S1-65]|uniref:DUF4382 domain-containing protein n=1 Tax=Steroidobacter gossypii TaxID=2805490 RepID=A0ABS1X2G5_9GAMM|nr:DUF4382 domain-containing protein [Steroidobacter gossypii]MBM0107423.1 DUF4382 domain-containing protein [Steroidobacter gossypii]